MRARYLPLVDRVTDREELNEVIAQMVGELSALHIFVGGGDVRKPSDHDRSSRARRPLEARRQGRRLRSGARVTCMDPDLPKHRAAPGVVRNRGSRRAKSSSASMEKAR